jgi:Spy/CpxP family protein refolding chaperone
VTIKRSIALTIVCLLASSAAWTLTPGSPLSPQAKPGDPGARTRLRENINTLMLVRMTQDLDLTEDQASKIYPVLTRIEKEKAGLQARLAEEIRDLRQALRAGGAADRDLVERVGRVRDIRRAVREKDDEFERVMDRNLTPVQKARYTVFMVDFYRALGDRAVRAREVRGKIARTP